MLELFTMTHVLVSSGLFDQSCFYDSRLTLPCEFFLTTKSKFQLFLANNCHLYNLTRQNLSFTTSNFDTFLMFLNFLNNSMNASRVLILGDVEAREFGVMMSKNSPTIN